MDPNNERKVFELMVETSTRPNTPQHFLMSPKVKVVFHMVWCDVNYCGVGCGVVCYGVVLSVAVCGVI